MPVVGRLVLREHTIPPAGIVIVRMCGGAIIFVLLARRGLPRIERADLPRLVGCAAIGVVANQLLFINGLARSTATNASVLGATIPVFTAVTAIVLGYESVRLRRLVGIAIAFAGAAALVGIDRLDFESEYLVGSLMILANSLCYGAYLVVVRPLADKYDPIALLAMLFLVGVPMAAPFGIIAWANAPPPTFTELLFLAFLIAVPTVGAYTLVQTALKRTEASLVAAYIYLQPVFTAIGAIVLLDEHLTVRMVVFAPVIMFGVWLAARLR